jgi:hypothetical protein
MNLISKIKPNLNYKFINKINTFQITTNDNCEKRLVTFTNSLFTLFSDYLFKLVLIGDSCVGKSCLLIRFAVFFIIFFLAFIFIG